MYHDFNVCSATGACLEGFRTVTNMARWCRLKTKTIHPEKRLYAKKSSREEKLIYDIRQNRRL